MAKKLELNGVSYDVEAALYRAHIDALIWIKENANLDVKQIHASIERLGTLSDSAAMWGYLSELDELKAWRGLVWLCRRRAGETTLDPLTGRERWLTLAEAGDVSIMDAKWVNDSPALAVEASPKAQTASEVDADPTAA